MGHLLSYNCNTAPLNKVISLVPFGAKGRFKAGYLKITAYKKSTMATDGNLWVRLVTVKNGDPEPAAATVGLPGTDSINGDIILDVNLNPSVEIGQRGLHKDMVDPDRIVATHLIVSNGIACNVQIEADGFLVGP